MKPLFFTIIFSFLLTSIVFADVKTYSVDLNNDGKKEIITLEDKFYTDAEGIITVSASDKKLIGTFSMPDHLDKAEFISLNNDGFKQIVAYSEGGAHYTNIAIYGYKDGKLYKIFENGSACPIEVDFEADRPIIKVGRAKWGTKVIAEDGEEINWSYASGGHGDCYWQVYVWAGEKFIYDEKLSSIPEISESEETQRYVDKAMSVLEKKKNK